MRLSKLVIRNFRSVGDDPVVVAFSASDNLAVLVGVNGAGKSNILHALGIVLGIYPFSRFEPTEQDFHCGDTERELTIELHLSEPLVERDIYQAEFKIAGFRMRCHRLARGDGKGILRHEHTCFGADGKNLVKPERIAKKAKAGEEKVDAGYRPLVASDYTWKLGRLFYLDAPSLEKFFDRTTGYSPLGRLFDLYRDDFEADANEFEIRPDEWIPSRDAFSRLSKKLGEILRTQKLTDIESELSRHTSGYLGLPTEESLRIEFALPQHRELFDKAVSLRIADCAGIPSLPAEQLGSGTRALLRLAVIESLLALSETDRKLVFLIEEPEIYLQVHLRRYFRRVLKRLSDGGHQIVCTTHSPEFVDLGYPAEVVRCVRSDAGSTLVRQVAPDTSFDLGGIRTKLRSTGNTDLFFARHALLTEGQDDQAAIEYLLRAAGVDPDSHAISVIQCGSANNLPDYIALCGHLGIDCFVVHDEDDPIAHAKRNDRIARAVTALGQPKSSLHLYRPRLEEALGEQSKCGLDALLAKLEGKSYDEIKTEYPEAVVPVETFRVTRDI